MCVCIYICIYVGQDKKQSVIINNAYHVVVDYLWICLVLVKIYLLFGVFRISGVFGRIHGGMPTGPSSYRTGESGSSTVPPGESQLEHDGGNSNTLADENRAVQVRTFKPVVVKLIVWIFLKNRIFC